MNFSKLSNVMLTENPIVELDSKQLTMIAGGCHGCHGCGGGKPPKRRKCKSSKSSKKSSKKGCR